MGNREDLLAGARRCLYEKGYTRTTARDIATAARTSLAAIGYHFGSTQALLDAALFEAMKAWGDELDQALDADLDRDAEPLERFEAAWERIIASFQRHRPLWATQFEMVARIEQFPEMRELLPAAQQRAREGLAKLFANIDASRDSIGVRQVGGFYHALFTGVIAQLLLDPKSAPSAHDLAEGLRRIAGDVHARPRRRRGRA